ncbi:MAG: primosomal protein N' [Atopostipes sp.]|nr:primosomal protein N' [Atopostipes sp.]
MRDVAEVIVDVPTLQTNEPYEFQIPENLIKNIEKGMRVIVPFGKGNRKIQGFVRLIKEKANYKGKLKEIIDIMDLTPVLNEEMLKLGEWIAQKSYSFRIMVYQSMLPAVLRARYEKKVKIIENQPNQELIDLFDGKNSMIWDEVESKRLTARMLRLRKENKVALEYIVEDNVTKKTKKIVQRQMSIKDLKEAREETDVRAHRQRQLIDFLMTLNEKEVVDLKYLRKTEGISTAVVQRGDNEGWCKVEEVEIYRNPYEASKYEQTEKLGLNAEQENAYKLITEAIYQEKDEVFLLEGVTGSGKTEVYMQSISKVLEKEEGALVLVPEISLTPQMVHRFKGRFGEKVAVLHSGLSKGEKYDEWRKIENNEAKVVVGARSSVFAPLDKIGLIVIDEEHEDSYKQSESPRYHARDVAIKRAEYHNCPVVLGSATPSLESRARAEKDVYRLIKLEKRINDQPLPPVDIIDMREEMKKGNTSIFSMDLQKALKDRLSKDEQSVLMLNRRGYSSFFMCRDCGFVLECPNCDISQTLHRQSQLMKCHYCGHQEAIPSSCPSCHSEKIRYVGTGTQKVEEDLKELLPEAKIIRMDVDTTSRKGAHERLLDQFGNQEADILLGTQMIAKGLDFPNVTFVGVLNADTSLNLPDFRAAENTFQLLTQVSGRAGRGELEGEVIVQSHNPKHYAIQYAAEHDYNKFYQREMNYRHISDYSPYYYLTSIRVSHENEMLAAKRIQQLTEAIKPCLSKQAIILGPTPAMIARTHNKYHYQLLIKYKKEPKLNECLHAILQKTQKEQAKGLMIRIDPEPNQFL